MLIFVVLELESLRQEKFGYVRLAYHLGLLIGLELADVCLAAIDGHRWEAGGARRVVLVSFI